MRLRRCGFRYFLDFPPENLGKWRIRAGRCSQRPATFSMTDERTTLMALEHSQMAGEQQPANGQSEQTQDPKARTLIEDISRENQPYNTVVMQLQRQVAN